ncbi:hypothetical protein ABE28_004745 [Peribacillus muralis]|uniref:Uncharacterized protein n=1 Tax=Peribacillus muralis TaxID=264697 RepID=A0A1B3XKB3_9BACI|nr:hypothetical protein ABE28_004745 [Peribacillus muralis]
MFGVLRRKKSHKSIAQERYKSGKVNSKQDISSKIIPFLVSGISKLESSILKLRVLWKYNENIIISLAVPMGLEGK